MNKYYLLFFIIILLITFLYYKKTYNENFDNVNNKNGISLDKYQEIILNDTEHNNIYKPRNQTILCLQQNTIEQSIRIFGKIYHKIGWYSSSLSATSPKSNQPNHCRSCIWGLHRGRR